MGVSLTVLEINSKGVEWNINRFGNVYYQVAFAFEQLLINSEFLQGFWSGGGGEGGWQGGTSIP